MNEVTKIHLGRQSFMISVEAQKELRAYLNAIGKQVGDSDVADEIELRMAELLGERGLSGDKVILPKDIHYLKQQLGEPKDFQDDNDTGTPVGGSPTGRRLFRDPDNAWLAGVASGIATFFGVDALLIRILFVLGTIAWGGSILVYIILWLLVPEAKTNSDRLQMAGKPITVDSLKEVMERANVKSAAHRANDSLSAPVRRGRDIVNTLFRLAIKATGIGLTAAGLMALVGLAFGGSYLAIHGNVVADNIFPIGFREHLLIYISAFVIGMTAIFMTLFGMATFRRKWPIRGWLTGVLVGITVIGLVASSALAADIAPTVRDRYNSHLHTSIRPLKPFTSVVATGDGVSVDLRTASTYSVSLKYFDNPDISNIKTTVNNNVLTIDSSKFDWHRHCDRICIPDTYGLSVTVYSPDVQRINFPGMPDKPIPSYRQ